MTVNIILNIFLLSFIITYIVKHSGIIIDVSKFIWKNTHKEEWNYQLIGKPFGCYNCLNFWIILFYCLFNNINIIESIAIGCLFSGFISVLIDKIIILTIKIINKI